MSDQFEQLLDLALKTRRQRLHQREAEQLAIDRTITDAHAKLEHMQAEFCGKVRSIVRTVIERANRHLAKGPDHCRLCEVSGYFTGPLYAGGSVCNPIAYELQSDGEEIGETLLIELTHDGMVEAYVGPLRPGEPQSVVSRRDFGWEPVPLKNFDDEMACTLVILYVSAVTAHLPIGRAGDLAVARARS